jgi:hypothetical protein
MAAENSGSDDTALPTSAFGSVVRNERRLEPLDLFVVSSRWTLSPATRSRLSALSIVFGNDLRICNVLQTVDQQVLHGLYILGEDAHIRLLLLQ